jgi:exopolyphosphatase/guanosine-5'-triphosphate,3'-diphosphate pyrophosphatase
MDSLASIDLGSHTFRLLIAEINHHRIFSPVFHRRMVTRLEIDPDHKDSFTPTSLARAKEVLSSFKEDLKKFRVARAMGVATGIFRKLPLPEPSLSLFSKTLGAPVKILKGEEEALLSFQGALWGLKSPPSQGIMVDIGGNSTEIITFKNKIPQKILSLDLGAVTLTRSFLPGGPPLPKNIKNMESHIDKILKDSLKAAAPPRGPMIVTGGTASTAGAMLLKLKAYDPVALNQLSLSRAFIRNLGKRLESLTLTERRGLPGLEPGREDIIIAGLAILSKLIKWAGAPSAILATGGLLEGALLYQI